SCQEFLDWRRCGISHRHRPAADIERRGRVEPDRLQIGVEQVAVIDLAIDYRGAGLVRFANDRAGLNPSATDTHAPGGPPVIAAVVPDDTWRAAEFREHGNERAF